MAAAVSHTDRVIAAPVLETDHLAVGILDDIALGVCACDLRFEAWLFCNAPARDMLRRLAPDAASRPRALERIIAIALAGKDLTPAAVGIHGSDGRRYYVRAKKTAFGVVVTIDPAQTHNADAVARFASMRGLTPRESMTLRHLCAGLRNSAIAEEIGISEATVKQHVSSILAKVGVGTRAALQATVLGLKDEGR